MRDATNTCTVDCRGEPCGTLYFAVIGSTIKCNSSVVVHWNLDAVKNCILDSGYICSVGAAWRGVRGFVGTDT